MRWPWQKDETSGREARASHPSSTDAAEHPSPSGWAFLPPLQRQLTAPPATMPPAFISTIPTRTNPTFLGTMGHLLDPSAPAGTVAVSTSALDVPVQRSDAAELALHAPTRPPSPATRTASSAPAPIVQRDESTDLPLVDSVVPDAAEQGAGESVQESAPESGALAAPDAAETTASQTPVSAPPAPSPPVAQRSISAEAPLASMFERTESTSTSVPAMPPAASAAGSTPPATPLVQRSRDALPPTGSPTGSGSSDAPSRPVSTRASSGATAGPIPVQRSAVHLDPPRLGLGAPLPPLAAAAALAGARSDPSESAASPPSLAGTDEASDAATTRSQPEESGSTILPTLGTDDVATLGATETSLQRSTEPSIEPPTGPSAPPSLRAGLGMPLHSDHIDASHADATSPAGFEAVADQHPAAPSEPVEQASTSAAVDASVDASTVDLVFANPLGSPSVQRDSTAAADEPAHLEPRPHAPLATSAPGAMAPGRSTGLDAIALQRTTSPAGGAVVQRSVPIGAGRLVTLAPSIGVAAPSRSSAVQRATSAPSIGRSVSRAAGAVVPATVLAPAAPGDVASGAHLQLLPTTIATSDSHRLSGDSTSVASLQRAVDSSPSYSTSGMSTPRAATPSSSGWSVSAVQRSMSAPAPTSPATAPHPLVNPAAAMRTAAAAASDAAEATAASAATAHALELSVQREEVDAVATPPAPTPPAPSAAPAGTTVVPPAAASGAGSPEELEKLAGRLYSPLIRRIKAELLLDRERRGLRIDGL